jgi:hypothetical protein
MDVEKLVEEVARAIARQEIDMMCRRDGDDGAALWVQRKYGSADAYADFRWPEFADAARSAILATLRGVREADRATVREGASCIFASVSEDVTSDERESDASASYTAMIDHLIKTVEG